MGKQLLLKNILIELSQLPETQVQHWYELIRSSRGSLSGDATGSASPQETDFDWDAFVTEVMENRQENNRQRMSRIETILND
jgi:hypothetical protein